MTINCNWSEILVNFQFAGSIFYLVCASVCVCVPMHVPCAMDKHIQKKNTYLSSSNKLNGSGNIDVGFDGVFIDIVMNGFLLFFMSVNNLFNSWGVCGFAMLIGCWAKCTGCTDCTGCTGCTGCTCCTGTSACTCIGICTGTGTWMGTFKLATGRVLTNVFGIWLIVADTVSFRGVI